MTSTNGSKASDTVAAVEAGTVVLDGEARRAIGIDGVRVAPSLRDGMTSSAGGWYLVAVLASFVAIDAVLTLTLSLLAPEIRASLGLSPAAYGIIVSQRANAAVFVSIQFAAEIRRRPRRVLVLQAAFFTGLGAIAAAWCGSFWPLFLAVALSAPTAGAIWALHRPLLMDAYAPGVRVRVVSVHQAGVVVASVIAPLLIRLLVGPIGLSWRGVLLVVGGAAVAAGFAGLRLRDPGVGRHDWTPARAAVREALGESAAEPESVEPSLGFVETLRRIWLVPTMRRLLWAWAVIGVLQANQSTYLSFLLADRFQLSVNSRAVFFAVAWAFAVPALIWFGRRGDALLRQGPSYLAFASGAALCALAGGLVVGALSPIVPFAVVGIGVAFAASAVLMVALIVLTLSVVRPLDRAHAGALVAIFLLTVGGLGGAMFLGGLDRRFGPGWAVGLLALPALVAAAVLWRSAPRVDGDLDAELTRLVEAEEIAALSGRGERLPMLACRHIDFSYGQLQVLFDVDFTVDDGEIVALLGTNGAGKSTLLRVISGLGFPTRGSVRMRGTDITYMDAERRVAMGISQVPGGRAVYGPLTVVENLRVLGYTHGRNRRLVEAGIDASFDAFPRLAERRNQLASTLSGGEQQMLGLATAFIMRPQVLMIDELSLGLAPKIVSELLDMVRRINADGTAVVLIEQSVNVALSLVEHAYFMEKGEIRFDGAAKELLARPDLLRSVFLEGASKGLGR